VPFDVQSHAPQAAAFVGCVAIGALVGATGQGTTEIRLGFPFVDVPGALVAAMVVVGGLCTLLCAALQWVVIPAAAHISVPRRCLLLLVTAAGTVLLGWETAWLVAPNSMTLFLWLPVILAATTFAASALGPPSAPDAWSSTCLLSVAPGAAVQALCVASTAASTGVDPAAMVAMTVFTILGIGAGLIAGNLLPTSTRPVQAPADRAPD
jgi:hypothetical protein